MKVFYGLGMFPPDMLGFLTFFTGDKLKLIGVHSWATCKNNFTAFTRETLNIAEEMSHK